MIKLKFPILATVTLAAAFIVSPAMAIEDCYSTPLTDAIDGAIVGGVVGAVAGNVGAGAAIGAGAAAIDGEYTRVECEMATDEAELEYHADQEDMDDLEIEAEMW